jgi:hypothetical protein
MAKKSLKLRKYLTFDQLCGILREMIRDGWRARLGLHREILMRSPKGRTYCYYPDDAIVKYLSNRPLPRARFFGDYSVMARSVGIHPTTLMNFGVGSEIVCSYRRLKAMLEAVGLASD